MAQLIQNGDVLSGTSNDSANILYSEPDGSSKNVQEKIGELDNEVEELNNNLVNYITVLKKRVDASDITIEGHDIANFNTISKMDIPNNYSILGYLQIDIWGTAPYVIPVPIGNNIRLINIADTSVTLSTIDIWVVLKKNI